MQMRALGLFPTFGSNKSSSSLLRWPTEMRINQVSQISCVAALRPRMKGLVLGVLHGAKWGFARRAEEEFLHY